MPHSSDIVIVGGGPAGATTAIALARAAPDLARRVVIVEKEKYPREKFCAGAVGRRGWAILERLGAVPEVPSVRIEGISVRVRDGEIAARPGNLGAVIRRLEFDHALVRIAAGLGVRLVEGTRVTGVERAGDGVRLETSAGPMEAAILVGADGVGSVVRRSMGLPVDGHRAQVLEVDTDPVPGDRDRGLIHFDVSDPDLTGYTWDFPTLVDGRPLVCRGIYLLRLRSKVDIQERLARRLAGMGLDLAKCRNKRFAERGFAPATRPAEGPLLLVGEASGIDPVTGEGIPQAIEYGALAGQFLAGVLRDGRPLSDWASVLARSRLGFDLRVRQALVDLVFGEARPAAERWMFECSNLLEAGCRHFAAMPVDWPSLAEAVAHGALRLGAARAGIVARRWLGRAPGARQAG